MLLGVRDTGALRDVGNLSSDSDSVFAGDAGIESESRGIDIRSRWQTARIASLQDPLQPRERCRLLGETPLAVCLAWVMSCPRSLGIRGGMPRCCYYRDHHL